MAQTAYGVNDNEAVKLWSNKLFHEVLKQTAYAGFIGTTSDSLVQIKTDTQKSAGDRIRVILRMQLTGDGVQGDGTLEGNEEALTTYTQDFVIDQIRHAVRSSGKMSEQRVPFSVREEARLGLQDWHADRKDTAFFNQICGNNAQSDTLFTGNNATTAPDSSHHLWTESGVSADESLTSAGTFDITYIDKCITKAETITPAIRPLRYNGKKCYVIFLHPQQVEDIRTSTSTGQWLDITKALDNGRGDASDIVKGFTNSSSRVVGMYNNTILISNSRVTLGVNSSTGAAVSNTRRAVFCGAQAAILGFGKGYGKNKMEWHEEMFDYGNQLGVAAGCIEGMVATRFNSADFAKIVVSSYSAT